MNRLSCLLLMLPLQPRRVVAGRPATAAFLLMVFLGLAALATPTLSCAQDEGASPTNAATAAQDTGAGATLGGESATSEAGQAASETATPVAPTVVAPVTLKLTADQQALLERAAARIESLSPRLDGIDQELVAEGGLAETRLVQLRSLIRNEQASLKNLRDELTTNSAPISLKLADLAPSSGEAPKEGETGPTVNLRSEIEALLAPFLALATQIDTLITQMDRQLGLIADQRRDLFLANIFTPTPAVFSAAFWAAVPDLVTDLAQSTSSLIGFRLKTIATQLAKPGVSTSLLVYLVFMFAVLALPFVLLKRYAQRRGHLEAGEVIGRPAIILTSLGHLWPPLWLTLCVGGFVLLFQVELNLVSSFSWLITSLAAGLAASLLVARLPSWLDRTSALPSDKAFLARANAEPPATPSVQNDQVGVQVGTWQEPLVLALITALVSLQFVLQGLIDIFDKPVESEWLVGLIFAPLQMLGLFWLLQKPRFRRFLLRYFPWIFGAWPLRWALRNSPWIALAGLVLGFIAMVGFVLPRLWIVLMVFMVAAALRLSLYLWLDNGAAPQSSLGSLGSQGGDGQAKPSEQSTTAEGQESASDIQRFWLVLAVNASLLALGLPLVLMLMGYDAWALLAWLDRLAQPIALGSLNLSPFNLILGGALFGLAWMAVRYVKVIMAEQVLPRTNLMADVRHSLVTLMGYVGFTIAGLVGLGVAGLDLSRFALIAGALSVGIGFGLQAIVSNFVSGLILLFERPVKLGDWVVLNSGEGIVKRISIRATEIETFDGRAIMVPNSELISSPVANWTHRSHKGRVTVTVGVAYESDPKEVEAILYQVANDNALVLRAPAPVVYLANFGDSSLDFQLRVHIADIFNVLTVSHQLRLAIFEAFRRHDISIPFPQQELRIKTESDGIQFASPVLQVDAKPEPPRDS